MSKNFTDLAEQVVSKTKELNKSSNLFKNPRLTFTTGKFNERQKKAFLDQLNSLKQVNEFPHVMEVKDQSDIFQPTDVYIDFGKVGLKGNGVVKELDFIVHSSESYDDSLLHQLLGWTRESEKNSPKLKTSKKVVKTQTKCMCQSPHGV